MPSFLKRLTTFKGSKSKSAKTDVNKSSSQYQQNHGNTNNSRDGIAYELTQELAKRANIIIDETTIHQDNLSSLIPEEVPPVPTPRSSPGSKQASTDNLGSNPRPMSEYFSSVAPDAQLNTPSSPTIRGRKLRPKSVVGSQARSNRWSTIGTKDMMVDLETTGVFVPSNGQRLRVEFVYRTVTLCADEIRSRGLDHVNIFGNPSPKKVISSMIALMMDQERCDLYSIQFLRIDTVAGLMINLLSQMSNPVIPYPIMEHYFKMATTSARSQTPATSPASTSSQRSNPMTNPERSPSPIGLFLPTIPALPPRGSSQAAVAWAREHFDLPAFLDILPPMNRMILLEVLHLCRELLDHQMWNRVTFSRLVEQIAPALFSTVFDRKILDTMAGSRRCSIHGDTISHEEGSRAEIHLFSVILVRFLYLTIRSSDNTAMSNVVEEDVRNSNGEECSSSQQKIYGHGSGSMFRKSQELLQQDHQDYHERVARSYQEMEIQQQPLQHFGVYSESQKQQQQQQLQLLKQKEIEVANRNQEQIVPCLGVSTSA
ncbi:hypothetical protein BGZ80_000067 [Entomortierella chlamydospora]|uniref:Rho-GAP domain-containing protein n=1 Tax=Entomortierella chlamydospora TaxID=101097 RepID=A0A9P6SYU4_9FUNG|nr:hypothetical protein BGZ79_002093 [Entomortierella chlamydospora]KAG0012287.1 hypothetical protein BGZ80_000067 [Entomortierella chlamydospora]